MSEILSRRIAGRLEWVAALTFWLDTGFAGAWFFFSISAKSISFKHKFEWFLNSIAKYSSPGKKQSLFRSAADSKKKQQEYIKIMAWLG